MNYALSEARTHLEEHGYIPDELLSRLAAEDVAHLVAEHSASEE